MVERLRRYLDTEFEEVATEFPDWHLGVHVSPNYEQLPALPAHLNRLADIYAPESAELTLVEQMAWSADHSFHRGAGESEPEPPVVDPADRAQTVGWAGPHAAVGAFNYFPEVFEHKSSYVDSDAPLSVVVINNSMGMFDEHQQVVDNYRERVEELPIMELEARSLVTPETLAAVFEEGADLVHFIGHSDERGLRCPDDRYFHPASLKQSRAQTFFLNACSSFDHGRELIRRGSVAGVVTRMESANPRATQVGNDWSRLMANGWSAERGLDVARRATNSPSNYLSLGDGAHSLTPTDGYTPPEIYVESRDNDRCRVTVSQDTVSDIGAVGKPWGDRFDCCLHGETRGFELDLDQLVREFSEFESDSPIVFDGDLIWEAEELR